MRCKLTKKAMAAKGDGFVEVDVALAQNAVVSPKYTIVELGYTEAPVVAVGEDYYSGRPRPHRPPATSSAHRFRRS